MVWYPSVSSLTRTHYNLYTYQMRKHTTHLKVSLDLLSIRCIRIELCCHLCIQLDTVPFHTQVVERFVPSI